MATTTPPSVSPSVKLPLLCAAQVADVVGIENNAAAHNIRIVFGGDRAPTMQDIGRAPGTAQPATVPGVSGTHFHPRDVGCFVSCDQSVPSREWLWAGPTWHRDPCRPSSVCTGLAGVQVAAKDPP